MPRLLYRPVRHSMCTPADTRPRHVTLERWSTHSDRETETETETETEKATYADNHRGIHTEINTEIEAENETETENGAAIEVTWTAHAHASVGEGNCTEAMGTWEKKYEHACAHRHVSADPMHACGRVFR